MKEPRIRILIVDDNQDILNMLISQFEKFGFEVSTAKSGNEAFKLAGTSTFDVVLSDVQMPDGTGIDLLKKLVTPDLMTPVFLFTGDLAFDRKFALALGAKELFRKPVNAADVISAIKKSLNV